MPPTGPVGLTAPGRWCHDGVVAEGTRGEPAERSAYSVEAGTLLVAAPSLTDPNFARTVVFVIDHRREGTLGVILNRPSEVAVSDVLPTWGLHTTRPSADRKSTRLNSSHSGESRMPSSA